MIQQQTNQDRCESHHGKDPLVIGAWSLVIILSRWILVPDHAQIIAFFASQRIQIAVAVEIDQFHKIEFHAFFFAADFVGGPRSFGKGIGFVPREPKHAGLLGGVLAGDDQIVCPSPSTSAMATPLPVPVSSGMGISIVSQAGGFSEVRRKTSTPPPRTAAARSSIPS